MCVQAATTRAMSSSVTSWRSKVGRAFPPFTEGDARRRFPSSPASFPNRESLPYWICAASFDRSPARCACSSSSFACSNCDCTMLTALTAAFSFCHCAVSALDLSFKIGDGSLSISLSRSLLAGSFSFASDVRSISNCKICRSSWSSSVGLESSSILMRDAASSTRSIALSGRNRSVM